MRRPSRMMPRSNPAGLFPRAIPLFAILLAGLFYIEPKFGIAVLSISVAIVIVSVRDHVRITRLAKERQGESICTFARSFERRSVDTWILRAVYEGLEPWCRSGQHLMPLRPTDHLRRDLHVDPDDLEEAFSEIARRADRSTDRTESNPLYGRVETVGDLVAFLMNQPRLTPPQDHTS